MCCWFSPAFAQGPLGRAVVKGITGKTLLDGAKVSRLAAQQQKLVSQQLKNFQLVPLKINTATVVQTTLAVPQTLSHPQGAVGTLLRSTYMQYGEADNALDVHVARLNQPGNTTFLYRGMHITDLKEIEDIWANGLPVGKTGYNSIYMSSNHAVARHYAKLEEGIPVVVMIKKDVIAGSLRPANLTNFYAEQDIPFQAIFDVFVLLDINGTPGWHRVMWQDKLVFVPLTQRFGN